MRMQCNGLLIGLLLATAGVPAFAADPEPAVAPPPPGMSDPGQPATAESIKPDDPRLAPLPPESAAPAPAPAAKSDGNDHMKSDGDPSNLPALPTDDAFHPPPKKPGDTVSADGYSIRSYVEPNGDRVEEYRHGGQLTKVKVQPAHGKAFELHDSNGDGRINRNDATRNETVPVQWSLFEWH
jgi:hypothetical protein